MQNILVIVDAPALYKDIIELLIFEEYDVLGATNGMVGTKIARDYHPELIICDVKLPDLDGYAVLAEVRKEETAVAIPFLFLNEDTDKDDLAHKFDLGLHDYLTKPFRASELLKAVRRLIEPPKVRYKR